MYSQYFGRSRNEYAEVPKVMIDLLLMLQKHHHSDERLKNIHKNAKKIVSKFKEIFVISIISVPSEGREIYKKHLILKNQNQGEL